MPNQSLAQIRFETMKHDALTDTSPKDLSGLLCDTCELCVTFGGTETFEDSHFTLLDVCVCKSVCAE